ncbi:Flp pilus assembly protein CpaB [Vibrio sp. WJH972]
MSSKIIILIAVVAIGLGLWGLKLGFEPKQAPQVVQLVKEEKVKIYIAGKDLDKGEQIQRDSVSIEYLAKSQANKKGIDKDSVLPFDSILLARKPIQEGDIIYPEFTIDPTDKEYVDFVTKPGSVPFPLEVEPTSVIGGVIHANSVIDILAMSSKNQNLSGDAEISNRGFTGVTLTPILMGIKVIKVNTVVEQPKTTKNNKSKVAGTTRTTLILELLPKQVATMTVAKKIAKLEVHKSVGNLERNELSADAGDVLEDYKSIKEFRANEAKLN